MSTWAAYEPEAHGSAASIGVRLARQSDVAGILAVAASADVAAWQGTLARAIGDARRMVVVATLDDAVAGYAKTHRYVSDDGDAPAGEYLAGLVVDPAARRRGIGGALTRARLDWIADREDAAWCIVSAANRASLDLHARFGFDEVAHGDAFHGVRFEGGRGVLLRAPLV